MTDEQDEARARLAAKIEAVRVRFLDGLGERTRELERLCSAACAADAAKAAEARRDLRRGLHNLAGAASTLGLRDIGREAGRLEAEALPDDAERGLARDVAERLAREIAALRDVRS